MTVATPLLAGKPGRGIKGYLPIIQKDFHPQGSFTFLNALKSELLDQLFSTSWDFWAILIWKRFSYRGGLTLCARFLR